MIGKGLVMLRLNGFTAIGRGVEFAGLSSVILRESGHVSPLAAPTWCGC